jgi:hypothetical protein
MSTRSVCQGAWAIDDGDQDSNNADGHDLEGEIANIKSHELGELNALGEMKDPRDEN